MRIGLDLDGCVYDWVASVHRHLDTSRSELVEQINEAIGPDFDREWKSWTHYKTWPLDTPTFLALCNEATNEGTMFSLGEPSLGARRAIDRIRDAGHDIVFVTARNFGDPGVAQAKTLTWLKTYGLYVEGIDELHFAEDKTTFDLDYLLDDRVETLRAVDGVFSFSDRGNAGTTAVRFRQPWNEEMGDEVDVVESMDEFADLVLEEGAWAPVPRGFEWTSAVAEEAEVDAARYFIEANGGPTFPSDVRFTYGEPARLFLAGIELPVREVTLTPEWTEQVRIDDYKFINGIRHQAEIHFELDETFDVQGFLDELGLR